MPDLDDYLDPATGRGLAETAGAAARVPDPDELTRRGVRRARRTRAGVVAGVAATTAIAVALGVGVSGVMSADRPPPADTPAPDRITEDTPIWDLSAEELARHPRAVADVLAIGGSSRTRLVTWTARQEGECLRVAATTDDDGAEWTYGMVPAVDCQAQWTAEVLADGRGWALSSYLLERRVVVVGTDGTSRTVRPRPSREPLRAGEVLLPMGGDQTTVAVDADGAARLVGWDKPSTAVAEAIDPTGRVVSQGVGAQRSVGAGLCCYTGAAVRWSDDGGRTFAQHELAAGRSEEGAVNAEFLFTRIPDSHVDGLLAAVEGGETNRGPRTGGDLVYDGVHRSTDGGVTWERFTPLGAGETLDVGWAVVAPDGSLLLWHQRRGLLRTDGDDWTSAEPVDTGLEPPQPSAPLGLVDQREVDGELELVVEDGGDYLRSSDAGESWESFDAVP